MELQTWRSSHRREPSSPHNIHHTLTVPLTRRERQTDRRTRIAQDSLGDDADKALAAILASLSLLTRFAFLNYPEKSSSRISLRQVRQWYIKGEYFFDIHPPLGKLVLRSVHGWVDIKATGLGNDRRGHPRLCLFSFREHPFYRARACTVDVQVAARLAFTACSLLAAAVPLRHLLPRRAAARLTDATLLIGIVLQLFGTFSRITVPLSRGWFGVLRLAGIGIALAISTKWTGASTIVVAGIHSLLSPVHGRFSRRDVSCSSSRRH